MRETSLHVITVCTQLLRFELRTKELNNYPVTLEKTNQKKEDFTRFSTVVIMGLSRNDWIFTRYEEFFFEVINKN